MATHGKEQRKGLLHLNLPAKGEHLNITTLAEIKYAHSGCMNTSVTAAEKKSKRGPTMKWGLGQNRYIRILGGKLF